MRIYETTPIVLDLNLEELIARLKHEDPNRVLPIGFANPHAYRGYYDELAFEPVVNITIGEMLEAAESALHATFEGYKGGHYTMNGYTTCWIAYEGSSNGQQLGALLLDLLLQPWRES